MSATKTYQQAPSTKTECDYPYGWIKKTVTCTKISPKMVKPRDLAGSAEDEESCKFDLQLLSDCDSTHAHSWLSRSVPEMHTVDCDSTHSWLSRSVPEMHTVDCDSTHSWLSRSVPEMHTVDVTVHSWLSRSVPEMHTVDVTVHTAG